MSGHVCPECGEDFPSSSCALGGSVGHDCQPRDRPLGDLTDERIEVAKATLRAEFGDPITVWHGAGEDAWDTVIGMFTHTGWTPPNA